MIILITYLLLNILSPDSETIGSIRELYPQAAVNKEKFEKFNTLLSDETKKDNLTEAYRAAAKMIEANYVSNPITKLNYFNEGKEKLEKCIKKDNKNTELIYLRFTIQSNAPAILGYSSNLKSDKEHLINNYTTIKDKTLKNNVTSFLKQSKQLTSKEKENIK